MTVFLIVLGTLLGLLALFLLIPARVRVKYDQALEVWIGAGPLTFKVMPIKPAKQGKPSKAKAEKKPRKASKKPSPPKSATKPKLPESLTPRLTLEAVLAYVRLGKAALGRMLGAVRIRRLRLHGVVAASDPGKAALAYGGAATAINTVLPGLERIINWRDTDILIEVDFEGKASATVDVTVTVMPIVALVAALRALRGYMKINRQAGQAQGQEA